MRKRFLTLTLTLCLLLGLLPTTALAAPADAGPEEAAPAAETAERLEPASLTLRDAAPRAGNSLPFTFELAGDTATSTGDADYIAHYFGPDKIGSGDPANMLFRELSPGWDGYQLDNKTATSFSISERKHYRNSDLLYVPFTISVEVPANTAYTVTCQFSTELKRNSEGKAGYYQEYFYWTDAFGLIVNPVPGIYENPTRMQFMTGDTDEPSVNSLSKGSRLYSAKEAGISGSVTTPSIYLTNSTGEAKTMTSHFGTFIGVGKADSILGSYHHQLNSRTDISVTLVSERKITAKDMVAEVAGTKYTSIEAALSAFNQKGGTLTLLKDVTNTAEYPVAQIAHDGWVDLGGHTWYAGGFQTNASGNISIENGTLAAWDSGEVQSVFLTKYAGGLNMKGVTLDCGNASAGLYQAQDGSISLTNTSVSNVTTTAVQLTREGNALQIQDNLVTLARGSDGQICLRGGATINFKAKPAAAYDVGVSVDPAAGKTMVATGVSGGIGEYVTRGGGTDSLTKEGTTVYAKAVKVTFSLSGDEMFVNTDGLQGTHPTWYTHVTEDGRLTVWPRPTSEKGTFGGWVDESNNPVSISTSFQTDTILHAQWYGEAIAVTLHLNYGDDETFQRIFTRGAKYGIGPKLPSPGLRDHYTFAGWYTAANGGELVTDDSIVPKGTGDVHLYAHWTPETRTVKFDTRGGTGTYADQPVPYGGKVTKPATNPIKAGYTFIGWYDGVEEYDFNKEVKYNMTLFAEWKLTPKPRTITLNANGGTVNGKEIDKAFTVQYPGCWGALPEPTKTGNGFLGWYTAETGGDRVYSETPVKEEVTTLYAHWNQWPFSVSFYSDGDKLQVLEPQHILPGEKATEPDTVPTREGYSFLGWYLGDTKWDFDAPVNRNMILKAKWGSKPCTVTLDANGGTFSDGKTTKTVSISHVSEITDKPTRPGCTLSKWLCGGYEVKNIKEDGLTLSAVWTGDTYTVKFNLNANSGSIDGSKTKSVTVGKPFGAMPTAKQTGKEFLGWYTAASGGDLMTSTTAVPDSKPTNLYARWGAAHTHDGKTFEAWGGGTKFGSSQLYLTQDVTNFDDDFFGGENTEVHLCLNGHTLSSTSECFILSKNEKVHVYDCAGGGCLTRTAWTEGDRMGSTGEGHVVKSGDGSEFHLHSGRIDPAEGSGVCVTPGGKFFMYGGEISGCHGPTEGPYVSSYPVYVGRGDFQMTGGRICDNAGNAAVRCDKYDSSFTMTGGEICNNTGGGVVGLPASFTLGGTAKIYGNTGTKNRIDNVSHNLVLSYDEGDVKNGKTDIPYISIAEGGFQPGAEIHVSYYSSMYPYVYVDGKRLLANTDTDWSRYFFSDEPTKYHIAHEGGTLNIVDGQPTGIGSPDIPDSGYTEKPVEPPVQKQFSVTFITGTDADGKPVAETVITDRFGRLTADQIPTISKKPGFTGGKWVIGSREVTTSIVFTADTVVDSIQWTACGHGSAASSVTKAASCKEEGETTYTCPACTMTWKEPIARTAHDWPNAWEKADDTQHVKKCTVCQEVLETAAHAWAMTEEGSTAATCTMAGTQKYTCVCGATKEETLPIVPHEFGTEWQTDGTSHWQKCGDCGAATTKEAHTWQYAGDDPTCTTAGTIRKTCAVCGRAGADESVEALGHAWSDAWESDGTHHWHVCLRDGSHTSARTPHNWDAGRVTREAAEGTPGEKTYTCADCGQTRTESYAYVPPVEADKLTVTYSGGPYVAANAKVDRHEAGSISLARCEFSRFGYSFAGWSDGTMEESEDGGIHTLSVKLYGANAAYPLTDDVTFTAQWELHPSITLNPGESVTLPDGTVVKRSDDGITVTIDRDGDGSPETTITVPTGETVTVKQQPEGSDRIVVEIPDGSTVQTGSGPAITIPEDSTPPKVTVDLNGVVDPLPKGTTIDNGDTKITVTDGDAAVDQDGNVTSNTDDGEVKVEIEKDGEKVEGTISGESSVSPEDDKPGAGGTVSDPDGNPVSDATVELRQGNTVCGTATTDENGEYTIINVEPGIYDLVVKTDDGKTLTKLVTVTETGLEDGDATLGENNSVLDVTGDTTPLIVVGGLDVEAEKGGNVTMTVSGSEPSGDDDTAKLKVELSRDVEGVLELVLPFQTSGETDVIVTHDGTALAESDTGAENTYRVDEDTGLVHIFIRTGGDFTVEAGAPPVVYTVTFNMQGHGTQLQSLPVAENSTVSRPADPTAEGYTFGNWYKDADCTTPWNFSTDTVNANTTLYAKWNANTYRVSFDLNGVGSNVPSTITVTYGSAYGAQLPIPEVPAGSNYTFLGWFTAADDTGAKVTAETVVKLTADQTLYAHWTTKEFSAEPDITGQPTAPAGDLTEGEIPADTKLTVTVEQPTDGTITYQWYEKDEDGNWQPIPGAKDPDYSIPTDTEPGSHEYKCVVTNQEDGKEPSSTDSDTVTVVVKEAAPTPDKPTVKPQGGTSLKIEKGETEKIEVAVEPEGTELTWESSNPDVATVDKDGNVTAVGPGTATITVTPEGGDPVEITVKVVDPDKIVDLGGGITVTLPDDKTPDDITDNGDGTKNVPGGSTVHIGDDDPAIILPDGGDVDPGTGEITVPDGDGSKITITDDDGNETDITVPGGGTVKPNDDGTVTVPEGSVVQTGGGPEITVPDGTKVDPDGTITLPEDSDGKITITDGDGNETDITVPGGGTVKPNDDGTVTLPDGGTVQTDDGPEDAAPGSKVDPDGTITPPEGKREEIHIGDIIITLPEGTTPEEVTNGDGTVTIPEGSEVQAGGTEITVPGGSTVDTDGTITLPEDSGGRITITDGDGNETEITLPDDDKTVKPNGDGSVTVPGGSEVEKPDGSSEAVPEGGAKVKPDGTVTPTGTPAHTHAWATTWTSDAYFHWHACTAADCPISDNSQKGGYAAHRENGGTVIKAATAGEPGLRMYQCVDCQRILRTETISALGFEISGTVTQDSVPVSGATVTLRQGRTDIAETTTDEAGNYSFAEVAPGTYNVVGTKDGKTVTKLVVLTEDNATGLNLEMSGENVNSILEVEAGDGEAAEISRTVVGGLDEEAEAQKEENATVTVTMTVEKEAEDGTDNDQTEIRNEAGTGEKLEFLKITITKEVTSEQGTESEELKETKRVIEIVIPYDFSGKEDVTVYRHHNSVAKALNKSSNKDEGTFWLDRANGLIYIYAQKFSTYAISYTEAEDDADTEYIVTVHGGEGSGTYKAGETVFISPEVPSGKKFDGWTTSASVTFTARQNGYTFTMPEANVDITAKFEDVSVEPPAPPSGGDAWDDDDDDEPTYRPAVEKTEHGSVTVRPGNPEQGDRVTITVKPDKGYEADEVTVIDRDGDPVRVRDNGDGTYTFTQPEGKVTITATFRAVEPARPVQPAGGWNNCPRDMSCPIWPFTDAGTTAWYHDGVHYCIEKGLMNGFTDSTFKPDATLSRAQLAQILYNREGRPAVFSGSPFTDVADDAWCASAVIWANQNGIVGGYGDGRFGPNDPITREQLAAMLWRYAKAKGYDVSVGENTNILGYKDFSRIHEYAVPALQWATGAGVMQGKGDGILDPIGRATRAQAAVMLQRYLENAAK